MEIKRIKITNFKSIKEAELEFSKLEGIWQISGPVGSGKTSIGEAVVWGLFGSVSGKTNQSLVNWNEASMKIELELFSKGKNLKILRSAGKKAVFDVFSDGQQIIASSKNDLQKTLENDFYDCSRMAIETLCLISFDHFKSIATFGTGAKRDFLNTVMGFSLLNDYMEIAATEYKESSKSVNEIEKSLRELEGEIRGAQRTLPTEGVCTDEEYDQAFESLKKWTLEIRELQAAKDTELSEYRKQILYDEKELSVCASDGKKLKSDIAYLEKGICPTCGAKLDTSMLETYKKSLDDLREHWKEIAAHKEYIEIEMKGCQTEHDAKIADCNGHISDVNFRINKMKTWRDSQKIVKKDIEGLKSKQENLNKDLLNEQNDNSEWQDLKKTLDSTVRQRLLSRIVPVINERLVIRSAQIGFPFQMEFNNEFDCIIKKDSMEIPISSLSTGQLKLADMSIIISILDVLMKGVNFNIRFFDELLSNMDPDTIERVCSCLKDDVNRPQCTFLISHTLLPSALLDGTISIVHKDDQSEVFIQ